MKLDHEGEYICECENWEEPVLYPIAELIRCRECMHYDGRYCHHKGYGDGYVHYTPPIKSEEGFCDWAKEREEE